MRSTSPNRLGRVKLEREQVSEERAREGEEEGAGGSPAFQLIAFELGTDQLHCRVGAIVDRVQRNC